MVPVPNNGSILNNNVGNKIMYPHMHADPQNWSFDHQQGIDRSEMWVSMT